MTTESTHKTTSGNCQRLATESDTRTWRAAPDEGKQLQSDSN
jgi:hypothetical protein